MSTAEETKPLAAQQQGGALAVVDFGDDAGKGMQNISDEERRVPFLRILQSNSPELEEGNAKYLPGATAGKFFNTSTKQTYSKLVMIPAARGHRFIEYIPRNLGSGFVAVHGPKDELVMTLRAKHGKFGKLPNGVTKRDPKTNEPLDGTEIVESFELYAILIDPETEQTFRAVISFSSTQIKKYQGFIDRYDSIRYRNSAGQTIAPPIWAHRWLLTTATEKNKKGTFRGFVIGLEGKKPDGSDDVPIKSLVKTDDPLYKAAKDFNDFVERGQAEVDYGAAAGENEPEDGGIVDM